MLDNLEDAILRIKLSYTKNELVPFFDTGRSPQAFGAWRTAFTSIHWR